MNIFSMDYTVNFRDVDRFFDLTTESLMHILGKISTHHEIEGLGFRPGYMQERNMAWILYQWNIKITEPKQYARNIHIDTITETLKDMYVHRYFRITGDNGKIIGWASAVWVVIDTEKRRVIRIPDDLKKLLDSVEKGADLTPFKENTDDKPLRFRLGDDTPEIKFDVLYSDIDMNGHVTNAVYGRWALEAVNSLDEDLLMTHYPEEFTCVYKKEKKPGGSVTVKLATENNETKMEVLDEDGTLLNLIRIRWAKRDATTGDYSDYSYPGRK